MVSTALKLGGAGGSGPGGPIDLGNAFLPPVHRIIPLQGTDGLERNLITRGVSQDIAAGLNHLAELATRVSTLLTPRIREGDEVATARLSETQRELRRVRAAGDWLVKHIDSIVPARDLQSGEVEPFQHYQESRAHYGAPFGRSFPRSLINELARWFPEIDKAYPEVEPKRDLEGLGIPRCAFQYSPYLTSTSFQRIMKALEIIEESTERIHAIEREERSDAPNQSGERTCRVEAVSEELAETMSEMIMRHHRRPGDPEIQEKGVVIGNISPDIILKDVIRGSQAILCYRDGDLVGLSIFFAPERPPSYFSDLTACFPDTKNAILDLVLVDPSAQGSDVFEILMNGTLTAIQAAGAELLIGQVEHSNDRAQGAYRRKYGGEIHPDIIHEVLAPSGQKTNFYGLSIPVPWYEEQRNIERKILGLE